MRSKNPFLFFSRREKQAIVQAIREAERLTSGEIRVHLERGMKEEALAHAEEIFQRLRMTETKDRNGVLILLGLRKKQFFILGDRGIHEKVPSGFWDSIRNEMTPLFKEDRFAEGLVRGIRTVGEKLKAYFPYQRDDINELPDGISYSL